MPSLKDPITDPGLDTPRKPIPVYLDQLDSGNGSGPASRVGKSK